MRTAKLALVPYVTNPNNIVYGASGAVLVAMANQIPVITSESNMFDDLNNVVPRPNNAEELSKEIDKIFSDHNYKNNLISLNNKYIQENIWEKTADRYLDFIKDVLKKENFIEIV